MDVAKFVANKMKKFKICIPTTFGSGSEVTRISVLKVDNKKQYAIICILNINTKKVINL